MKAGIVRFPGSNCDADCFHVMAEVLGKKAVYLWHEETSLHDLDLVVLPGGFAHGDYLRTGAMAKFSPILRPIREFAKRGGLILGICNGFQILTEAGLLPGALLRNLGQKFLCAWVDLRVDNHETPFTRAYAKGEAVRMPIAHGEGRYYLPQEGLRELEANRQVVFRYAEGSNLNGSVGAVAGVCNARGNVMGLMPHPERCSEKALGGEDGLRVFRSLERSLAAV